MTAPNGTRAPETTMAAFMERLLEPLPAEALVDTQYNTLMRQARWKAWHKANVKTRYLQAKREWKSAQDLYRHWVEGVGIGTRDFQLEEEIVAALRQAIAEQILTPAPDKAAVRWKKGAAGGYSCRSAPTRLRKPLPMTKRGSPLILQSDRDALPKS